MANPRSDLVERLTELTAARVQDRSWRMERFAALLAEAGSRFSGIHLVKVTGTNGKGSVVAMLEACLTTAGFKVGLSTSPHLERITERIRIGGREISADRFEEHLGEVEGFLRDFLRRRGERYTPSFFEALLLVSFRAFEAAQVDFALYEAGVGGAHDPTSLVPGFLSILTTVGFDHESELGDTLAAIATEKVGIATPGSTLVLGPAVCGDVRDVVERVAAGRGLRVVPASRDRIRERELGPDGSVAEILLPEGPLEVRVPLAGEVQMDNLATVVAAVEEMERAGVVSSLWCLSAVERTRWPARVELVPGAPSWLLDGAHNEEAMGALISTVRRLFGDRNRILVYGTTARKSYCRYLPRLGEIAPEVWITDDFDDAENREVLARALAGAANVAGTSPSLESLFAELESRRTENALIVVAGSLYLVGKAKSWLARRGAP